MLKPADHSESIRFHKAFSEGTRLSKKDAYLYNIGIHACVIMFA